MCPGFREFSGKCAEVILKREGISSRHGVRSEYDPSLLVT